MPGLLPLHPREISGEDLQAVTVPRLASLAAEIARSLTSSSSSSNRQVHQLITGPHGIGKSHLLQLVLSQLADQAAWLPVVLPSESYSMVSVSDIAQAVTRRLGCEPGALGASQAPCRSRGSKSDEQMFVEAHLAAWRSWAAGRGLVIVLEGLDRVLCRQSRQTKGKGLQDLFRLLTGEASWLRIVATASSVSSDMAEAGVGQKAFQVHRLSPLALSEATDLLARLASRDGNAPFLAMLEAQRKPLEAVYDVLGGLPLSVRLIYLLAGRQDVLDPDAVVGGVLDLLGPRFMKLMDDLGEKEGKVLATLATMPGPARPVDIAKEARLKPDLVRATLMRLARRGVVGFGEREGRNSFFALADKAWREWLRRVATL